MVKEVALSYYSNSNLKSIFFIFYQIKNEVNKMNKNKSKQMVSVNSTDQFKETSKKNKKLEE